MKSEVKETFAKYDTADYLKSEEQIEADLEAIAETGDATHMVAALGTVARALSPRVLIALFTSNLRAAASSSCTLYASRKHREVHFTSNRADTAQWSDNSAFQLTSSRYTITLSDPGTSQSRAGPPAIR